MTVTGAKAVNPVRIVKRCDDFHGIVAAVHGRLQRRLERELSCLSDVVSLACANECQMFLLARLFGAEPAAAASAAGSSQRCGTCSWCTTQKPLELTFPPQPAAGQEQEQAEIPADKWLTLTNSLTSPKVSPLVRHSPRAMVRYAFGVQSPAICEAKMHLSNPIFGIMRGVVSFETMMSAAERHLGKRDADM